MPALLSEEWCLQFEAHSNSVFRGPPHLGGSFPKAGKIENNCLTHLQPSFRSQLAPVIRNVQQMNVHVGPITAASDSWNIHCVAVALSPSSFEQPLRLHSTPPVQSEARRHAFTDEPLDADTWGSA